MKKLLLLPLLLISIIGYSQMNTFGGIGLRVNDTTTYQTNASAYHTAGYYDIYFNNQAVNDHFDVWNGSSYDHIFSFGPWASLGANTFTGTQTFRTGGTGATTAPWKAVSGALNTTPEVGAFEFLTDKPYFTITTGAARKEFTLNDAALTSGRIPYITTNGRLTSSANLTFNGTDLAFSSTGTASLSVIENSLAMLSQSSDSDKAAGLLLYSSTTKAAAQLVNTSNVSGWAAGFGLDGELYDNSTTYYPAVAGNYFFDTKASSAGLQYATDYSANYTTRSLVDKNYVDALADRTLDTETSSVGNVTTGEDQLYSYAIPAGQLAIDGNAIHVRFTIAMAANANSKTLKVKYGATTIVSTAGAYTFPVVVECEIFRTGAATQKCNCSIVGSDTGITHSTYFTAAETLSGAVTLVVTGEATNTNDIVKETAQVKFER